MNSFKTIGLSAAKVSEERLNRLETAYSHVTKRFLSLFASKMDIFNSQFSAVATINSKITRILPFY